MPKNDTIIFDLETQKDFEEVGGREHLEKLGVSVLGAYSYMRDEYRVFEERELAEFEPWLSTSALVVGFNIRGFDLPVLRPHVSIALDQLPILDLMDDIVERNGFRVSLDSIANASLGMKKSAHGLQAVWWYREGKIQEIKEYCLQDVRLTKAVYEYGKQHGHVLFHSKQSGGKVAVPVRWDDNAVSRNIPTMLRDAFERRRRIYLTYAGTPSSQGTNGSTLTERAVDIYRINGDTFEAYCHLREAKRIFRMDRVTQARVGDETYRISEDVQGVLL